MNKLLLLVVCLGFAGCDYTVPLTGTPELEIDRKTIGLWERTNDQGQRELLLVLPLNESEYLISYPLSAKNGMFAKAFLYRIAGKTLVQLRWIGTAKGSLPENNRVYQFAAYEIEDGELRIRLLNTSLVSKDTTSSAQLASSIEENRDSPDLFREPLVFKKVKE
jgi:hypothetical protein